MCNPLPENLAEVMYPLEKKNGVHVKFIIYSRHTNLTLQSDEMDIDDKISPNQPKWWIGYVDWTLKLLFMCSIFLFFVICI